MNMTRVLVWTRGDGAIIRCESDYFPGVDTSGGTVIAEGDTPRHKRAQVDWFADPPLYTADGIPNYKLVEGEAARRTAEEIQAERDARTPGGAASSELEQRVETLEKRTGLMLGAVTEGTV